MSPYSSQLNPGGFDSFVPYYTPYGASQYNYVPTKSNFLSNQQLGSFSYDINEPRYQKLYKDYYNFYNKNLDNIMYRTNAFLESNTDINYDRHRKIINPKSYDYTELFD